MTDTKTKQQPKLSVIRKGHWRNKWHCPGGIWGDLIPLANRLNDYEYLGDGRWPSSEIATEEALKSLREDPDDWQIYLGPVFFPEEGEQ